MSHLLTQLYWREPLWVFLALFPIVLAMWQFAKQHRSLRQYAEPSLHPWIIVPKDKRYAWQRLLYQFLIWMLLGIAAAGPRLLDAAPEALLPPTGAVVIIIDHSRSMQADDVQPGRRLMANQVVSEWLQRPQPSKLGLIIFAGGSHVVVPPTLDQRALQKTALLLQQIQLPTHGSALGAALQQARSLLRDEVGSRAIIVLTDGDVPKARLVDLSTISRALSQDNIGLHLLGVGMPSPMALTDTAGSWLLHDGLAVTTALNEKVLRKLAENPYADYHRLNPDTHRILNNIWKPEAQRIDVKNQGQVLWLELFPWFLLPALILILFSQLKMPGWVAPQISIALIGVLIQPLPIQADGLSSTQLAYSAWEKKKYSLSARLYSELQGYDARMGQGASCFRIEQLSCAIRAFSRAAWLAENNQQRGRAAFNLANSFFKQGDFNSAITLYRDALKHQPEQPSYRHNLDFSEEVQNQIELRLKQEAASQNSQLSASGRSVNIDDGTVVTPNMRITLAREQVEEAILVAAKVNLSERQIALYMRLSQNFASLAGDQSSAIGSQHDWTRFSNQDPSAASQVEFWQRLFEFEEEIYTRPSTPNVLPGVDPW